MGREGSASTSTQLATAHLSEVHTDCKRIRHAEHHVILDQTRPTKQAEVTDRRRRRAWTRRVSALKARVPLPLL